MPGNKCKTGTICCVGLLCACLFIVSLNLNYSLELTHEHVRFRKGFPSQANWVTSPDGRLKCYLFNVTNSENFLNGKDSKLKIQEIGPITYRIRGRNEVINQTDTYINFKKIRYHEVEFDPEASCDPDILNKTIILPNFVLLGAAAKLHDWVHLIRHAFNAITINESIFLKETIHYFLWEFTTPALNMLSNIIPNIIANCGMLKNALRGKDELYNVKIGVEQGVENFFRVNSLNRNIYFPEQSERIHYLEDKNNDIYCPIDVKNAFDNSIFPPFITPQSELTIVAAESCRTHRLKYNITQMHLGLTGYKFVVADGNDSPNCLDNSMGIKLHQGMFDATKCLFNEVPSAFSAPHFYGSSYNWSRHFEGFEPSAQNHETYIIIQPNTGIPLEEKYRFQSNIPMPDMKGYNKDLQLFTEMVIPTFWYEYDLDDLPLIVQYLMYFNISLISVLQPIFMIIFFITSVWCFLYLLLKLKGYTLKSFVLSVIRSKDLEINPKLSDDK